MSDLDTRRKEILQLLANGKITAEEASELLSGLKPGPELGETLAEESWDASPKEKQLVGEAETVQAQEPRWLHVQVNDLATGRRKVTVNLPLRLVRFGLDFGSRFAPEMKGFDWDELSQMMRQEKGVLVDVMDEEDGEHVQIFVD